LLGRDPLQDPLSALERAVFDELHYEIVVEEYTPRPSTTGAPNEGT